MLASYEIHSVLLLNIQIFWNGTLSFGEWFPLFLRIIMPSWSST